MAWLVDVPGGTAHDPYRAVSEATLKFTLHIFKVILQNA
jgi:hypothetical protein